MSDSDNESHDHSGESCDHAHRPWQTYSLALSGLLVGAGLFAQSVNLLLRVRVALLAAGAIATGGWFLLPKAGRALLRLRPDINLLVVLAAIGVAFIGEWIEAAAVVFLFGVAEWLEGWADRRAQRAFEALLEIASKLRTA